MKEQIYTIPINEAFEQQDGCPVCRLARELDTSSVEYVMGAAMMEPDVRIETNKQGFCRRHFDAMLGMKNRLSLALILESHLAEIDKAFPTSDSKKGGEAAADKLAGRTSSCYVCNRAGGFMTHYYKNMIYLWQEDFAFRDKLMSQPYFCLPHHAALLRYGAKELSKKDYPEFFAALDKVNKSYLDSLRTDVSTFCKSFDYRFAGMELGDAKTSVERAAAFLSGSVNL